MYHPANLRSLQPTLEVTEEDFDRCFDINVKGVFFGTSAVIPQLLEQKSGGSIINIASVGATRPRPGLVWYNSSKGAVWNVRASFSTALSTPSHCVMTVFHADEVFPRRPRV